MKKMKKILCLAVAAVMAFAVIPTYTEMQLHMPNYNRKEKIWQQVPVTQKLRLRN